MAKDMHNIIYKIHYIQNENVYDIMLFHYYSHNNVYMYTSNMLKFNLRQYVHCECAKIQFIAILICLTEC